MSLEPQSQAVIDALNRSGMLPFSQFAPIEARQKLLSLRVPRAADPSLAMPSSEETIATPDGTLRVRVLRPRAVRAGEAMPAVIYFHGGGFFAGGIDETDELARTIAKRTDCIVVNVDYHLAPEARFPVAANDSYAALSCVASHPDIDPNRIVVAGESAGGNLTIVTCLMAREHGGPRIRFQVPIYPSLDLRARPQYASRLNWGGGGYLLSNDDIEWMRGHYLGKPADSDDWRASPIVATSYAGLPAALVVTAEHDPLVDEGKLYADRLRADGVDAEYACSAGTFHGFVGYASLLDVGSRALSLICDRIKQAVLR
jgi:acetyl esterase